MCLEIIYLIYMYKKDFALNNLQWLICHKTKPVSTPNGDIQFISLLILEPMHILICIYDHLL